MSTEANVGTVREIYRSFGAGDVQGILARLTDDVVWIDPGGDDVPHAGHRKGKAEVGRFFAVLSETTSFQAFTPGAFVAQGDVVVVLGSMACTSKATGRKADSEWAMAWTFRDGKVCRYQAYTDTNALAKSHRR